MTASAAFLHPHSPARPAAAPPATAPFAEVSVDARSAADRYADADAKVTARLALITGVAALVILVFFLAMMWVLAGYGPSAG